LQACRGFGSDAGLSQEHVMNRIQRLLLALLARTGKVYGLTASSAVDVLVTMDTRRRVILVVLDER
jgi:hypothetical protein